MNFDNLKVPHIVVPSAKSAVAYSPRFQWPTVAVIPV